METDLLLVQNFGTKQKLSPSFFSLRNSFSLALAGCCASLKLMSVAMRLGGWGGVWQINLICEWTISFLFQSETQYRSSFKKTSCQQSMVIYSSAGCNAALSEQMPPVFRFWLADVMWKDQANISLVLSSGEQLDPIYWNWAGFLPVRPYLFLFVFLPPLRFVGALKPEPHTCTSAPGLGRMIGSCGRVLMVLNAGDVTGSSPETWPSASLLGKMTDGWNGLNPSHERANYRPWP